jgi:hypothetical protein
MVFLSGSVFGRKERKTPIFTRLCGLQEAVCLEDWGGTYTIPTQFSQFVSVHLELLPLEDAASILPILLVSCLPQWPEHFTRAGIWGLRLTLAPSTPHSTQCLQGTRWKHIATLEMHLLFPRQPQHLQLEFSFLVYLLNNTGSQTQGEKFRVGQKQSNRVLKGHTEQWNIVSSLFTLYSVPFTMPVLYARPCARGWGDQSLNVAMPRTKLIWHDVPDIVLGPSTYCFAYLTDKQSEAP